MKITVWFIGFFFSILVYSGSSLACTTAVLHSPENRFVGKSYDWSNNEGIVVANRRGVTKRAMSTTSDAVNEPKTWNSKYASITFNQYGRDFANGGMNEAGLVVEMMEMEPSPSYLPKGEKVVSQLQWIQFVLDSYGTVEEVAQAIPNIGIEQNFVNGHFMVCDLDECAAVEVMPDRSLRVTKGRDLGITGKDGMFISVPVLANDHYDCSVKALTEYQGFGGSKPIPSGPYCQDHLVTKDCDAACRSKGGWFNSNSVERFIRAAGGVQQLRDNTSNAVEDMFDVLNNVYDDGDAQGQGGTRWQIVYDQINMKIHWRTDADGKDEGGFSGKPRTLDFSKEFAAQLDCGSGNTQMVGVLPQSHKGPTEKLATCDSQGNCPWIDFDQDINTKLVTYSGSKKPINLKGFRNAVAGSFPWLSKNDANTVVFSIWGGYVSGYTSCGGKVNDDQVLNLYVRAAQPFISQHIRDQLPAKVDGLSGGQSCSKKHCFIKNGCIWNKKTRFDFKANSITGLKGFHLKSIDLSNGSFTFTADLGSKKFTGKLEPVTVYCDTVLGTQSTSCKESFNTKVSMSGTGTYVAQSSSPGKVCFKDVALKSFKLKTSKVNVACGSCKEGALNIPGIKELICLGINKEVNNNHKIITSKAESRIKAVLAESLPGYFPRCP